MPRDINGNFTLDPSNPVATGTIIDTDWANPTMADIAAALTDSLSRTGSGGMLVSFKFADGARVAPGISWANEPTSGLYRASSQDFRYAIAGTDIMRITAGGVNIPNLTLGTLNTPTLVSAGDITVNVPAGSGLVPVTDNVELLGRPALRWGTGYFGNVVTPRVGTIDATNGSLMFNNLPVIDWSNGNFVPHSDNVMNLGFSPGFRWASGFFGTSVITPIVDSGAGDLLLRRAGGGTGNQLLFTALGMTSGEIIPDGDIIRNLGSAARRWSNLYVNSIAATNLAVTGKVAVPQPQWESGEYAYVANTHGFEAHGLGRKPTLFQIVMRCKVADAGYQPGDEIMNFGVHYDNPNQVGIQVAADAVNVYYGIGSQGIRAFGRGDSAGGSTFQSFTAARWVFVMRAW